MFTFRNLVNESSKFLPFYNYFILLIKDIRHAQAFYLGNNERLFVLQPFKQNAALNLTKLLELKTNKYAMCHQNNDEQSVWKLKFVKVLSITLLSYYNYGLIDFIIYIVAEHRKHVKD